MKTSLILFLSVWNLFGLLSTHRGTIEDLAYHCVDRQIVVDCRVNNLDGDAIREGIEAGEIFDFSFQAQLYLDRKLWFDSASTSATVTHQLSFNNLTGQYSGREIIGDKKIKEHIFVDFNDALRWLMRFSVRLDRSDDVVNDNMYLRVRVLQQKKHFLYVLPYEVATPWEKREVRCPGKGTGKPGGN